ncbi:MAG: hypothetical protein ACW964_04570 [Candidatus Hodarchaeales archaeon]|jgi:Fe-S-cluster containining protein
MEANKIRADKKKVMNCCHACIGVNGNDCCVDTYVILNPNEIYLFRDHPEFKKVTNGGIFNTTKGCPYFSTGNCEIHERKPLYCKYYPIYITGKPFVHEECSIHKEYTLTDRIKMEIMSLQSRYPIYKKDWFWEEVEIEFKS